VARRHSRNVAAYLAGQCGHWADASRAGAGPRTSVARMRFEIGVFSRAAVGPWGCAGRVLGASWAVRQGYTAPDWSCPWLPLDAPLGFAGIACPETALIPSGHLGSRCFLGAGWRRGAEHLAPPAHLSAALGGGSRPGFRPEEVCWKRVFGTGRES